MENFQEKNIYFLYPNSSQKPCQQSINIHFLEDVLKAVAHTIVYHRNFQLTGMAEEECETLDLKYMIFMGCEEEKGNLMPMIANNINHRIHQLINKQKHQHNQVKTLQLIFNKKVLDEGIFTNSCKHVKLEAWNFNYKIDLTDFYSLSYMRQTQMRNQMTQILRNTLFKVMDQASKDLSAFNFVKIEEGNSKEEIPMKKFVLQWKTQGEQIKDYNYFNMKFK